jgi:hypothetical protein
MSSPPPPTPPRPDAWELANARFVTGQIETDWILDWAAASDIELVEPGERYVLAAGAWGVGVLDLRDRVWVRAFRGAHASERAWLLWNRLEQDDGISFWRRSSPLWITLHTLLGLIGLGFVVAMLGYALVVLAGVDPERLGSHEVPVAIAWLAPLGAWLGFVYLRRGLTTRKRVLMGGVLLGTICWLLSVG